MRTAWPASMIGAAVALAMAVAGRPAAASGSCRAPRLTGTTLARARSLAARDGCRLHLAGAQLKMARFQTIARQSPAAGRRAAGVTVWLNPLCFGPAAYGPSFREPRLTAGPSELVSGFFVEGGPVLPFSDPRCRRPAPDPVAGTVVVENARGAVVATRTAQAGHLVEIPLAPGRYSATGTFRDSTSLGRLAHQSEKVVIPHGETVRQDFFLPLP